MPKATNDTITLLRASLAAIGKPEAPDGRFRIRDISVFAYSQGLTWWAYKGLIDRHATDALVPGFFDDARHTVKHGDLIWVPGRDDALRLVVLGARDGHIVVRPMLAAAAALQMAA